MSEFAVAAYDADSPLDLSVSIAALGVDENVRLQANNPQQTITLPTVPTGVFVTATGDGCALVQVRKSSRKCQ